MKKRLLLLALIIVFQIKAQEWEWVKTIRGVYNNGQGQRSLFTDNNGNVYAWGKTANHTLESEDFSFNASTDFIVKYSSAGNFRWIKTFKDLEDVDIDNEDMIWVLTREYLYRMDKDTNILMEVVVAPRNFRGIKSSENGCCAFSLNAIVKYNASGSVVVERDSVYLESILKAEAGQAYVIGSYHGDSVVIDGLALPPSGYFTAYYYGVLNSSLQFTSVSRTTGGYMIGISAASVLKSGEYVHGVHERYSPAGLYFNSGLNEPIWNRDLHKYMNNTINAFGELDNDLFCSLSSMDGGGDRASISLHRYGKNGDSICIYNWENVWGSGLNISPHGIYISGEVRDTAQLGKFTLYPWGGFDGTYFIGKLKMESVGMRENETPGAKIFPNPFSESCKILLASIHLKQKIKVVATDCLGREISVPFNIDGNAIILYRNNLSRGMYCCKVSDGDSILYSGTLLVEN
jgi:hypothetical protein